MDQTRVKPPNVLFLGINCTSPSISSGGTGSKKKEFGLLTGD